MSSFHHLIIGLEVGLLIASPLGPIDLLCIHNSLRKGAMNGFITGLGAAFADLFCAIIVFLGLATVTGFIIENKLWLQMMSGIFLTIIGFVIFFKQGLRNDKIKITEQPYAFFSTFFLAIFSPMTLLSFLAAFTAFEITLDNPKNNIFPLSLGVFTGSALWWLFLSIVFARLGVSLNEKIINIFNKSLGLILILAGLTIFSMGLFSFI